MHVLSLVPTDLLTEDVVYDSRNKASVFRGRVKVTDQLTDGRRPTSYSYRDCSKGYIKVAVPQEAINRRQYWSFKICSDYESDANIHLPTFDQYGWFKVQFFFARPFDSSLEQASLMMSVQSDSPSFMVRVVDADRAVELGPENDFCISWGNRHLRNPLYLQIGPYRFQIGDSLTMNTQDPEELYRAQISVATHLDVTVREDEWKSVQRFLGKGSHGEVHLVVGTLSGQLRAAKCFAVGLGDAEKSLAVHSEMATANTLSKFNHDHIVKYYGYTTEAQDSQTMYQLLFQACHGSLADLIAAGGSLIHFPSIANHLGKALQLLHSQDVNIMHRDVKPANVLYTITTLGEAGFEEEQKIQAFGNLKPGALQFFLSDFGASRIWDDSNCWSFIGTLRNLPPEVKGRNRGVYTKAADLFSLGVTLMDSLDMSSVTKIYERYVSNCGWPWEQHYRDRFHLNRYAVELQSMPVPRNVQPELWAFLKRMVAFTPLERPRISEVLAFFEDLIIYRDDPASQQSLLDLKDGRWVAGSNFRVGKASKMPKNLARTAAIASGFPYVPPPAPIRRYESSNAMDILAQVCLGATYQDTQCGSPVLGRDGVPRDVHDRSPTPALSPLFALQVQTKGRRRRPSVDWQGDPSDPVPVKGKGRRGGGRR